MRSRNSEAGYTLVQVIISVLVIILVAAVVVPSLQGRGGRQELIELVAAQVKGRRAEARRLAPLTASTAQENFTQPPLVLDFTSPAKTAPLRVDGTDANGDFKDDQTGLNLTRYDQATRKWSYAYDGAPLSPPRGWHLAAEASALPGGIGPITSDGGQTLGIPVSAVGFDASGEAWGDRDGDGEPESAPRFLSAAAAANSEAPFWAIYFTEGETAAAVAVHATGLVEAWTYTSNGWRGKNNRRPGN